jgi:hypothetical protein
VDIILAPDVYVNASVAPGSSPDGVVQRVLGQHRGESKATEWILARVAAMLTALPAFKQSAVQGQVDLIRSFVQVIPGAETLSAEAWRDALVASARAAGVARVVTDHPDLLKIESADGIEFVPTEAWLLEVALPPPPPGA